MVKSYKNRTKTSNFRKKTNILKLLQIFSEINFQNIFDLTWLELIDLAYQKKFEFFSYFLRSVLVFSALVFLPRVHFNIWGQTEKIC